MKQRIINAFFVEPQAKIVSQEAASLELTPHIIPGLPVVPHAFTMQSKVFLN